MFRSPVKDNHFRDESFSPSVIVSSDPPESLLLDRLLTTLNYDKSDNHDRKNDEHSKHSQQADPFSYRQVSWIK